jgi:hypothetical protein
VDRRVGPAKRRRNSPAKPTNRVAQFARPAQAIVLVDYDAIDPVGGDVATLMPLAGDESFSRKEHSPCVVLFRKGYPCIIRTLTAECSGADGAQCVLAWGEPPEDAMGKEIRYGHR